MIRLPLEVARVDEREYRLAGEALVDTGSEMTWIDGALLREFGVEVEKRGRRFRMANGDAIARDVGFAVLRCQEFVTVDEVVFGEPGDRQLIGARTLEGFNAVVDPGTKSLVAAGPIIAAPHVPAGGR